MFMNVVFPDGKIQANAGFKLIDGVKNSWLVIPSTCYFLLLLWRNKILNAVKYSAVCKWSEFHALPFLFVSKYISVITLIWFVAVWIKWGKKGITCLSLQLTSFLPASTFLIMFQMEWLDGPFSINFNELSHGIFSLYVMIIWSILEDTYFLPKVILLSSWRWNTLMGSRAFGVVPQFCDLNSDSFC